MSEYSAEEALVAKFYTAFQSYDAETMAACYHPEVTFEDPGFGELYGASAGNMWRMLITRGSGELELTFSDIRTEGEVVHAHWEAKYPFGKKKRQVHNIIEGRFRFKDGLIIDHRDDFDFKRWVGMALGPMGKLLGGTAFMRRKVRGTVLERLARFEAKLAQA